LLTGLRCSQSKGFLPGMDLSRYSFMFWSTVHGAVSLTLQNRDMDQSAKWDTTREAVDTLMEMIAATRRQEGEHLMSEIAGRWRSPDP
jgi:uncharacterized protein YicC (UPF0701 family)